MNNEFQQPIRALSEFELEQIAGGDSDFSYIPIILDPATPISNGGSGSPFIPIILNPLDPTSDGGSGLPFIPIVLGGDWLGAPLPILKPIIGKP